MTIIQYKNFELNELQERMFRDIHLGSRKTIYHNRRQSGKTFGLMLVADHLLNICNNKTIIFCTRMSRMKRLLKEKFEDLGYTVKNDVIKFNNNRILFESISENLRGLSADYILADETNSELFDCILKTDGKMLIAYT